MHVLKEHNDEVKASGASKSYLFFFRTFSTRLLNLNLCKAASSSGMAQATSNPLGIGGKIISPFLEALWSAGAKTFKRLMTLIPPALRGTLFECVEDFMAQNWVKNKGELPVFLMPLDLFEIYIKWKSKTKDREGESEEINKRGKLEERIMGPNSEILSSGK